MSGVIATIFMGVITLGYSFFKVDIFLKKSSMDILQTIEY